MKKQFAILSIVVTCAIFLFPSCQDDDPFVLKTKTELITQGSWSFEKATTGNPPIDVSLQVPACYKDNVVSFVASGNGSVQNTVVCTPTDTTPATFTWAFQTNETVISLNAPLFPGGSSTFNIVTLSETSLVISQDVVIPPATTPTNVVFYYKH
jgi:Lipocalin-like domain